MSYENVATTVFTPLEYGCVGLSEDQSIEKYSIFNFYFILGMEIMMYWFMLQPSNPWNGISLTAMMDRYVMLKSLFTRKIEKFLECTTWDLMQER